MWNPNDGLWDIKLHHNIPITPSQKPSPKLATNFIIQKDQSNTTLGQYFHETLFSPAISTLQQAIQNGNFLSWPIDELNFRKLIGTTVATELGYFDQENKNLQPTQPPIFRNDTEFPPHETSKKHNIFTVISPTTPWFNCKYITSSYIDLTGNFPHTSSRGTQYFFHSLQL